MKKIFSLLLASLACSAIFTATAFAASTHLTVDITPEEIKAGDTVTVKVSVGDISAASFAGGVAFDTSKLTLTGVAGLDPEYPEDFGLNRTNGRWVYATAAPTIAGANNSGRVGMTMSSTNDVAYAGGTFLTATFVVKEDATGDLVFNAFEVFDCAGTDGDFTWDGQKNPDGSTNPFALTKTVTIKAAAQEPTVTWKEANTETWKAAPAGKKAIWWPFEYAEGKFPGHVFVEITDGSRTETIGVGADADFDINGAVKFAVAVILGEDVDATNFDCKVK